MAKIEHFNNVVARFASDVDFVVIYINEAHPTDGWFLRGNTFSIQSHQTIDDRIDAARRLYNSGVKCPILVDEMSNNANRLYGGSPERLYVLLDDKIVYAGEKGPMGYDLPELEKWLEKNVKLH